MGVLLAFLLVTTPPTQATDTVYSATFLRAAPGQLLALVELLQSRMPVYEAAGEHPPLLLRHAQGDQWDLLVLAPIGSLERRFGAARRRRWSVASQRHGVDQIADARVMDRLVSWQEDLYVYGPPVSEFDRAAMDMGYFHLEVFRALAGKRDSLLAQRAMENDFLQRIGRPTNLVFRRITGPAWDTFTIGFYRDLQHYATPAQVTPAQEDEAARAAGFRSRGHIGSYLRRFLSGHHDTLGSIVR